MTTRVLTFQLILALSSLLKLSVGQTVTVLSPPTRRFAPFDGQEPSLDAGEGSNGGSDSNNTLQFAFRFLTRIII